MLSFLTWSGASHLHDTYAEPCVGVVPNEAADRWLKRISSTCSWACKRVAAGGGNVCVRCCCIMVHPAVNGFRDGHGRLEYLGHPSSFGPRSDLRQTITLEGRKHDRTEVRKRMNLSAVADTSFELFPPVTMSADTRQDQRQWEVGLIMKNNRTGHMDVV